MPGRAPVRHRYAHRRPVGWYPARRAWLRHISKHADLLSSDGIHGKTVPSVVGIIVQIAKDRQTMTRTQSRVTGRIASTVKFFQPRDTRVRLHTTSPAGGLFAYELGETGRNCRYRLALAARSICELTAARVLTCSVGLSDKHVHWMRIQKMSTLWRLHDD